MRLPNTQSALVDIAKIRDYCLSDTHPRGRHKARVFASALGLTRRHTEELCNALVTAAANEEAILTGEDEYGQRFVVDFRLQGPSGVATIRSLWIVRTGEDYPRFTTCYVI